TSSLLLKSLALAASIARDSGCGVPVPTYRSPSSGGALVGLGCGFVGGEARVGVGAQEAGGDAGAGGAGGRVAERAGLGGAPGDEDDAARLEDRADAHGERWAGRVFEPAEGFGGVAARGGVELDEARAGVGGGAGLVEADVAVAPDAEN